MQTKNNKIFITKVWDFYTQNKRDFSWRKDINPYKILLSEIMLQQTQTSRIATKFPEFLEKFADFQSLSNATLEEVLICWQGLGYNRRAKFLHEISKIITNEFNGKLPEDVLLLQKLPGIGPNTAGSIAAFAYNLPTIFIETNIRRVYIHSFFANKQNVSDDEIMPIVKSTLDFDNPREWYWALMDYGSYLKTQITNPNRQSKHYRKQSKFNGSNRQVRSKIISLLLKYKELNLEEISKFFDINETRVKPNILTLQREGFLNIDQNKYTINASSI
jgi:A/G-specific adenine glycosylase